jgi:hypothetical protein
MSIATVASTVGDAFYFEFNYWIKIHKVFTQASYTLGVVFDATLSIYQQWSGIQPPISEMQIPFNSIGVSATTLATTAIAINNPDFFTFPPGNTDFFKPIITRSFVLRHATTGNKGLIIFYEFV